MSKTLLCHTVRKHQTDYRVERNLKGIFVSQQWVNQQVLKHLTAVCAGMHAYVCMHLCLYVHMCMCTGVYVYTRVCTHVCVHMHVSVL